MIPLFISLLDRLLLVWFSGLLVCWPVCYQNIDAVYGGFLSAEKGITECVPGLQATKYLYSNRGAQPQNY